MQFDHAIGCWVAQHAPGAELDYGFDWLRLGWLDVDETVLTSEWSGPPIVTITREQIIADVITSCYAKIERAGYQAQLTNTITTTAGRTDSRTILLVCKAR